jgi:hypothetical protein
MLAAHSRDRHRRIMMRRKKEKKKLKHAEMTQSEAVVECRKAGLELGGAIASLTESGASSLAARLAPVLEPGEEMPDVRLLFRLMGRLAEREVEALDEADTRRWQAGMKLLSLRQKCQEVKAELYAATRRVRKTLVGFFGSRDVRRRFGLAARTARGTADLVLEAGRIERRLRSGPELPQPSTPGLTISQLVWAQMLRPGIDLLERLLREIEVARIRLSDLAGERNRRLESCRVTYLQVAHSVETLFVLAGLPDLAKSVRSSARWRRRVAEARRRRRGAGVVEAALSARRQAAGGLRSAAASIAGWLTFGDKRRRGNLEEHRASPPARIVAAAENR